MKKAKLLLVLVILMCACGGVEKAIQKDLDKVYIGMSMSEFKKVVRKTSTVYLSDEYSCLKLQRSKAKFGQPGGYVYSTRFFYFQDDKLWRMDEGERAVDYRIKIDN